MEILALAKASAHEYRKANPGANEDATRGYLYRWAADINVELTNGIVEEALRAVRP